MGSGASYWSIHIHFISISYCCLANHPQNIVALNKNNRLIISFDFAVQLGSAWWLFWSTWYWSEPQSSCGLTVLKMPRGSATHSVAWAAYPQSISVSSHVAPMWGWGFSQYGSGGRARGKDVLRDSFRSCALHFVGQNKSGGQLRFKGKGNSPPLGVSGRDLSSHP